MRLLDFVGEYEQVLYELENCEDGKEVDIGSRLNAVVENIEEKLEKCCWMYRNLCQESAALADESERLAVKAAQRGKQAESLKGYIAYCLQGKSVKTKTFSLSHRKSESVEIHNADLVPVQYKREKYIVEPDKALIKADIKAGATIPGAVLIEKQNLQIK